MGFNSAFKGLNNKLIPMCHLLALLGAHHILHVSRMRVNLQNVILSYDKTNLDSGSYKACPQSQQSERFPSTQLAAGG